jgi:hypothetical protein
MLAIQLRHVLPSFSVLSGHLTGNPVTTLIKYRIFSNTLRTFFPKTGVHGLFVNYEVGKDSFTPRRAREGEGRISICALVWMRLNTSHGQCPIDTFTFPPTRQAKPAKHTVRMYLSWWGQCVHVLWERVWRACVYDLSCEKLRIIQEAEKIGNRTAGQTYDIPESCIRDWREKKETLLKSSGTRRDFRGQKVR